MALILNKGFENGIIVNNSYARIDSIFGSKSKIEFTLNYYINKDAFSKNNSYLEQELYSFIPSVEQNSSNFIKQGYEYLKTLEEFKSATDDLEY